MVDLGKDNLFYLHQKSLTSLYAILDFLELSGLNILHFKKYNSIRCKSIEYYSTEELSQLILDNSFRLDMIIIDSNVNHKVTLKSIREVSGLPIIFLTHNTQFDKRDFDYVYKLGRNDSINKSLNVSYSSSFLDKYHEESDRESYFEDLETNDVQTVESLKIQSKREYKLNLILKK